jgi:hypothetical protein
MKLRSASSVVLSLLSLAAMAGCSAAPGAPEGPAPGAPSTATSSSEEGLTPAQYKVVPPPRHTPWAIVLCTTSDYPTPTFGRLADYYTKLFTYAGAGTNNITDYWTQQSYGALDFTGTVVKGWYNVGKTRAQLGAEGRSASIQDCINAARADVDPSAYYNFVAVYDVQLDMGAAPITLTGSQGVRQITNAVVIDPESPFTGITHEMGHGFSLDHSYSDDGMSCGGSPGEYCDWYDVMSAMGVGDYYGSSGCPISGPCYMGPGLAAYNRYVLGWMPETRRQMWTPALNGQAMTLAARNHPEASGPLMITIPASPTLTYTAEYIQSDGFEQGLSSLVILHKIVQGDEHPHLVNEPGGQQATTGHPYYDATNGVWITLNAITPATSQASITVTVSAPNQLWQGATPGTTPLVPAHAEYAWVSVIPEMGDTVPPDMYVAGSELVGGLVSRNLGICRAWYYGLQPGKVVNGGCSFPWGGAERWASQFEVLVNWGSAQWVNAPGGVVAPGSLQSGYEHGHPLYSCRANFQNGLEPGKVVGSLCDISWGGAENWVSTFQTLVPTPG